MNTYTPGVYVEEISTLPPSVAPVATAIPAFIGYTALGEADKVEVAEISTLLEFRERFGQSPPTAFEAGADGSVRPLDNQMPAHLLWYAIDLYFRNGGGRCYVISVDNTSSAFSVARFQAGLTMLKTLDEPTLIVMPEVVLLEQADFNAINQAALAHAQQMADRFVILDVKGGAVADFRDGLGMTALMYGAAYHPYLQTALTHLYDEEQVEVTVGQTKSKLSELKLAKTDLYNKVLKSLASQRVVLPPSAAVAGVYARTDRDRGVWKAPANASLSSVIGPTRTITHEQQEKLNFDDLGGKSINAIRAFSGKGTLVWGARTLDGNSNEWRYVNVRRLFITIEESCKKASHFAVFESNDATTWLKVKGMIEAYLGGLWEQGALQGAKPEQAFQVNVGLGKTMTPQDILEGRMIVELKIAAVRPAEFIVLRFSHKLAEA